MTTSNANSFIAISLCLRYNEPIGGVDSVCIVVCVMTPSVKGIMTRE